MIAVILEVWPHHHEREQLTTIVAVLRPAMDQVDGFISIERFECLTEQGKLLVIAYWRDEDALNKWRQSKEYQQLDTAVRSGMVKTYRLRLAIVTADYGPYELPRDTANPQRQGTT